MTCDTDTCIQPHMFCAKSLPLMCYRNSMCCGELRTMLRYMDHCTDHQLLHSVLQACVQALLHPLLARHCVLQTQVQTPIMFLQARWVLRAANTVVLHDPPHFTTICKCWYKHRCCSCRLVRCCALSTRLCCMNRRILLPIANADTITDVVPAGSSGTACC